MNGTLVNGASTSLKERPLKRYVATREFNPVKADELGLSRGDILLVTEEFDDGWMRGLNLRDLEIGFFPASFVAEDTSPIYYIVNCDTSRRSKIALYKMFATAIENKVGAILFKIVPTAEYFTVITKEHASKYDPHTKTMLCGENDIFLTEEAYLEKMIMLNEKYLVPLASEHTVINPDKYSSIFANLQPLLSLSESIWVQLKSRMEAWDERYTRIGDVFMHMEHLLKLFVTYAFEHKVGSRYLENISTQEKFQKWLTKTEMECQQIEHSKNSTLNTKLNSLLLDPILRVPRYKLLLEDLIKHTPEDHPDYNLLRDALDIVLKTASGINENIRRAENELQLLDISKKFPNNDVNLFSAKKRIKKTRRIKFQKRESRRSFRKRMTHREFEHQKDSMSVQSFFESEHQRVFVKEGVMQKTKPDFTDPSERYLFLCSDVLLISQSTSRSHKTYRLKERVMLVHAWITDTVMAEGKIVDKGFVLGTPKETYNFIAATIEEKNTWFQELRLRIFDQKKLFNKLLSHLSVPDETFECRKVKARVSYLGMFENELSFSSGDEIGVMGFKNGTNKWKPGLYTQEPFNPSPEWFFGVLKKSFGWFPIQCVEEVEPTNEELFPAPMCTVLSLKERMVELTGRLIPPLTESQRVVKVCLGEGNFKTLRIPRECTVDDVVRMYFKVKPDSSLAWSLIEQSTDETVHRMLDAQEDPSQVVGFWGKCKDQMRFLLKQSIVNTVGDSDV